MADVVIVGAGHAGAQAAIALRQGKFAGSIALVGDEPELPYERPPLSKEYLAGEKAFERLLIRPGQFWEDRQVEMALGHAVVAVDPITRTVKTSCGEAIGYSRLIWAAGGNARKLDCPGEDLAGVHTIRTRADVDRLVGKLPKVTNVVVIGGGFIGLEAAAVLRKLGKQVVLLEAQNRVMARVAGPVLSRFYEKEHRSRGVDLRLGMTVEHIFGGDRVRGVRLANGAEISADLVVIGIGIVPAVAPLIAAGAAGANGIHVDAQCRTSLADIYAVGDCAIHANRFAGGAEIRIESVQNAADQANIAARSILGEEVKYEAVPWFWSNQYDLKLQTIGLSNGYDLAIVRGDPGSRSFSIVHLKQGRVIALDCVNSAKDYVQGRKLVENGVCADPQKLVDISVPLKDLA